MSKTKKFNETVVLSLGGSLINPDGRVDTAYLRRFRQLVIEQTKKGRRFIVVCGGGMICREYQRAAGSIAKLSSDELDWMGIEVTRLNAALVRLTFGRLAYPETVTDPSVSVPARYPIVVGAGWKPGCSTDYDTVLLAQKFGAKMLVNLTNVDQVYDRDPKKDARAKPLKSISWPDYRKLVGSSWRPGANWPFDPIASKLAQKSGLRVAIANGRHLANLKKLLDGGSFKGTVIGD